MRLYLDSASLNEWEELLPTGLFYGVTTNPLLVERAGMSYASMRSEDMIECAAGFGLHEFHLQLVEANRDDDKFCDAIQVAGQKHDVKIVFKLPLDRDYAGRAKALKQRGAAVLMTACYDAKQMFVAQALAADYIAPYYGRMDDAGIDARAALRQMKAIAASADDPCQILVASLRSSEQMTMLAADGHELFTISAALARDLLSDKNSNDAIAEFEAAALR